MKKLIVLIFTLILAAACTTSTPTNSNAPVTNTNATTTASPAATPNDEAIVREEDAWGALEKKDFAAFGDMLASDYVEVGDENVFDKPGTIAYVKDLNLDNAIFSDWKVIPISNDAVILNYSVVVKGSYKGEGFPEGPYRASAAWANRNGKWQALYYQETLAGTGQPTTPPATTATPKTAATPTTRPAETAVPTDPIAREKMAWDMLKRKDFDGFASMLDSAQINVETDGVYDKDATVKGLMTSDLSKYQLSDFKTTTISPDAELVTYVVKSTDPKAPKERHTTIWVKRGDKWLSLFHQGTPEHKETAAAPAASPKATASPAAKPAKG